MHELRRRDYERVWELFQDLRYNLVVESVIAGHTPARICIDDAAAPRAAWMWNRMGTMLLAGRPDNHVFNRALSVLLREHVVPDARRRQIPALTLHVSPDGWEESVDLLLPGVAPEKVWRRFYQFDHLRVDWRGRLPSEAVMRRLDRPLLQNERLRNHESILGWILSFWHTVDDFLEKGFGFCLVQGEAIVSWCLTVYASGDDYELGLATAPGHRNRGYATLVAAACVEHSVEHGFTPHWHCDEENLPSVRVAEKVGFSDPTRYQVYTFPL